MKLWMNVSREGPHAQMLALMEAGRGPRPLNGREQAHQGSQAWLYEGTGKQEQDNLATPAGARRPFRGILVWTFLMIYFEEALQDFGGCLKAAKL